MNKKISSNNKIKALIVNKNDDNIEHYKKIKETKKYTTHLSQIIKSNISDKELFLIAKKLVSDTKKLNSTKFLDSDNYDTVLEVDRNKISILYEGIPVFSKKSIVTKIFIFINIFLSLAYLCFITYYDYNITLYNLFSKFPYVIIRWLFGSFINMFQMLIGTVIFFKQTISYEFHPIYVFLSCDNIFVSFLNNFINLNFFVLLVNLSILYYYSSLLEYKISTSKNRIIKFLPKKYNFLLFFFTVLISCSIMYSFFIKKLLFGYMFCGNSLVTLTIVIIYAILFPEEDFIKRTNNKKKNNDQLNIFGFIQNKFSTYFESFRTFDVFCYLYICTPIVMKYIYIFTSNSVLLCRTECYLTLIIPLFCHSILISYIFFFNTIYQNISEGNYYLTINKATIIMILLVIVYFTIFMFVTILSMHYDQIFGSKKFLDLVKNWFQKKGIFKTFITLIKSLQILIFLYARIMFMSKRIFFF